jgi:hypothetical protein
MHAGKSFYFKMAGPHGEAVVARFTDVVEQFAEKLEFDVPAPEGVSVFDRLTVSLKALP